ncbi:MAG: hypothetical protein NT013_22200 [Planctomycetia bacterium]|nr:hypothetical protein [Planctomycetia bacterium]
MINLLLISPRLQAGRIIGQRGLLASNQPEPLVAEMTAEDRWRLTRISLEGALIVGHWSLIISDLLVTNDLHLRSHHAPRDEPVAS